LNREKGSAILFISHDIAVVTELCTRVIVMYAGRVVEEAGILELFDRPLHPYTRGLMASIPRGKGGAQRRLSEIPGIVPSLREPIIGCSFAPRCPLVHERCLREAPPLDDHGAGHRAACWAVERVTA